VEEVELKELKERVAQLEQDIAARMQEANQLISSASAASTQAEQSQAEVTQRSNQVASLEGQISQKNADIDVILVGLREKEAKLDADLAEVQVVFEQVKADKLEVERIKTEASKIHKTNQAQTASIQELLKKASAGSLFNAFNLAKREYSDQARFWMYTMAALVVLLVLGAAYLVNGAKTLGFSGYILARFALLSPLLYALVFAQRQYTKNRRLEEAYGFKSALSLSLEAYRDMIRREAGEATQDVVIPVLTLAVTEVFSSPSNESTKQRKYEDKDVLESIVDPLIRLIDKIKG